MRNLWAGEWHSHIGLDRAIMYILYNEKYGYIKERKGLRVEPHGWRLPRAVKVVIKVV